MKSIFLLLSLVLCLSHAQAAYNSTVHEVEITAQSSTTTTRSDSGSSVATKIRQSFGSSIDTRVLAIPAGSSGLKWHNNTSTQVIVECTSGTYDAPPDDRSIHMERLPAASTGIRTVSRMGDYCYIKSGGAEITSGSVVLGVW